MGDAIVDLEQPGHGGVGVSAYGCVNHLRREDEIGLSLCGVELIRAADSITAWTLCAKCERILGGKDQ